MLRDSIQSGRPGTLWRVLVGVWLCCGLFVYFSSNVLKTREPRAHEYIVESVAFTLLPVAFGLPISIYCAERRIVICQTRARYLMCLFCGHDLRGLLNGASNGALRQAPRPRIQCPECGHPYNREVTRKHILQTKSRFFRRRSA
jgi:hypothetical protein